MQSPNNACNTFPKLGNLTQAGKHYPGCVFLPRMGLFTQDGSFYPGWATLPRLGNHSRQKACMFRPKIYPSQKKLVNFARLVSKQCSSFFCHQWVWQREVPIWTETVKRLGTLQFRQWHISRWRSLFLGCSSTALLREWKGMARSKFISWDSCSPCRPQRLNSHLRLYRTLSLNHHTLTYSQIHPDSLVFIFKGKLLYSGRRTSTSAEQHL